MSNKTSDKNVANIEDDVKILEEFAEICKAGLACSDQTREGEALERILAELGQKDKRIQELEAKLEFKEFGDLDNIEFEAYMSQFISKQVVRDKIKELKNDIKNGNTRYPYIEEHKIEVLQELLGGEK